MIPQIPLKYRDAERWSFGDTESSADELAKRVMAGTKTATCSNLDDDPEPEPGEVFIVVDGRNNPVCAVQLTEVKQVPFDQVTEQHAWEEGEGDRTLAYWRKEHQRFFEEYEMFEPTMPLLLMKFRMIEKF
ncbi:ASCH domain-containing protein [Rahnella contaminans]|uniref:ASCH domain-containing protein n=1 Tax=Rahnella contaminans TaxID=2703882 RepID=UPI001265F782|nr:ASCH domain-containing protein [Rahnella contaminans]KAB8308608.1 ASCH domain-containing protein [Rouxiella chamberiensis]MDF1893487.1 ASCH domain-containing protein [Rahnella contaminans]